jgi:hypothetical protein
MSEIDETREKVNLFRLAMNRNDLAIATLSIAFTTDKAVNIYKLHAMRIGIWW